MHEHSSVCQHQCCCVHVCSVTLKLTVPYFIFISDYYSVLTVRFSVLHRASHLVMLHAGNWVHLEKVHGA